MASFVTKSHHAASAQRRLRASSLCLWNGEQNPRQALRWASSNSAQPELRKLKPRSGSAYLMNTPQRWAHGHSGRFTQFVEIDRMREREYLCGMMLSRQEPGTGRLLFHLIWPRKTQQTKKESQPLSSSNSLAPFAFFRGQIAPPPYMPKFPVRRHARQSPPLSVCR